MPTAIPFTATASLSFSPDGTLPEASQASAGSGAYDAKDDDQFNLTGSGSTTLTLKGVAKGLQIVVDASATAAPINVRINGGTDDIEISPGGHLQLYNPVPVGGITSVTIAYTTANVVKVIALA